MPTPTIRTTLALPADLLAAVDQAVQAGHARSRNELVAKALQRELAPQPVSYTHLTLPTIERCRSRWSPYH